MTAVPSQLSPDEFLAWEREQELRHHYVHGEIFDMSGGTARHAYLSARIIGILHRLLEGGPCAQYTTDLRLALASDHFVYADVAVICGPLSLHPGTKDTVTNPSAVLEVLSKSTEGYDRGEKLGAYLELPSMRQVVLVSQNAARVDVYTRQPDGTIRYETVAAGGTIDLSTAVNAKVAVDELYGKALELPKEA